MKPYTYGLVRELPYVMEVSTLLPSSQFHSSVSAYTRPSQKDGYPPNSPILKWIILMSPNNLQSDLVAIQSLSLVLSMMRSSES